MIREISYDEYQARITISKLRKKKLALIKVN
jgi:hypothetical protein